MNIRISNNCALILRELLHIPSSPYHLFIIKINFFKEKRVIREIRRGSLAFLYNDFSLQSFTPVYFHTHSLQFYSLSFPMIISYTESRKI
jgi:hypothetical protein